MADEADSKSVVGNHVWVQVPLPAFTAGLLILMVAGGILGGMVGRKINKRIDGETVNKLFIGLMAIIMLICAYNIYRLW